MPFKGGAGGQTPPVAEYEHGAGPFNGNSVTGGYVYRGPSESLQGLYVFGDFISGNIWSIPVSSRVRPEVVVAAGEAGRADRAAETMIRAAS